ncbi:hypothetical protein BABINDRAFT_9638 [Babjeviella inositovora NRRL Y-12698]|uniref:Coatomer subunit gamma n=1 Tax=Babjeviella inositovora NRRL Y-12698 TaxID=984486 RepID=A0A1E3QK15_9ASCO|nr:uncharacterized protein BABINDRAFT_9638 [Babjeviella inositovora NRRL Y-12698]ODQ78031.1 hypothetical protein BABINDRAFT_9638 [Babjeviella inositovora NRRL Y-12698]
MSTHSYKKHDDAEGGAPDKMTVFQDCLLGFNALPVSAKKCRGLLAKLLRLLYSGETFPASEATTLFFSISKLFQHKDSSLRQLVYLAIKELSLISDDVLMVTSSIMKDVQSNELVVKPNAIRTLARVLDGSTVNAAERLMKNAVVDKNPIVASAALLSSYHLLPVARDVVKRWTNETQEAVTAQKLLPSDQFALHEYYGSSNLPSATYSYQYHALGLLYLLRNHDRMSLMKMIQQLSGNNSPLKSPMAIVQLIRFVAKIAVEDPSATQALFPLLAAYLRHKSDMVELEAAKAIVALNVTPEQFLQAINTLQVLLSAPRTVTRFAAVRVLNRISMKNPEKIVVCNAELEGLVNDPNRSISTYAITTLLKTGSSDNVDRLIKTIAKFMGDISDEFKIVVVDSIRTLALKFPEKHGAMLRFLNELLRDDGGFAFKNSIVEALFDMIRFVPASRDGALEHLCEFIEDCEFTELSVRILHLLGEEGPKTNSPTLYIRHIYNRVVLENSIIRSSAVIALSKFALLGDAAIKKNIQILLTRCLNDVDDEVRDRAAWSLKLIASDLPEAQSFVSPLNYSLPVLEQQLALYVAGDKATFATPFDIHAIPVMSEAELNAIEFREKTDAEPVTEKVEEQSDLLKTSLLQQKYSQELSEIPEIAAYGSLLHSSKVVALTEKETEFVVTTVKHVFANHLLLQYDVENTLTDIELHDVTVIAQPDSDAYAEEFSMPIDVLRAESKGTIYVSYTRPTEVGTDLLAAFGNTLSFITKEVDPDTQAADPEDDGFQDEYQIEDLEVGPGDFIVPAYMANFTSIMDALPHQQSAVFNLGDGASALLDTVAKLVTSLSMLPLENSEVVDGNSHVLKLFGKTIWGGKVGVSIRLAHNAAKGTLAKVEVRAEEENVAEMVVEGIN